jgi:hypothetical protein
MMEDRSDCKTFLALVLDLRKIRHKNKNRSAKANAGERHHTSSTPTFPAIQLAKTKLEEY